MPIFAGAVLLCPIILASLCYQGHGTVDPIFVAVLGVVQMALLLVCHGGLQARPVLQQREPAADSNMQTSKQSAVLGQKPNVNQQTTKRPVPAYHSLYKSKLQQYKVAIKIRTEVKPCDLPDDIVQQFQQALEGSPQYNRPPCRMQLSGLAVRSGCVLFSLDLVTQDQSSGGADGTMSDQRQTVLASILRALKPALQQARRQRQQARQSKKGTSAEHSGSKTISSPKQISPMGPNEDMIVQVDDLSWTVTWDSDSDSWQACPAEKPTTRPSTELGLVQLITTKAEANNISTQARPPRSCESSQHETAELLVQLWDLQGDVAAVGGWKPPPPGSHAASKGLKVLAHMDGCYLQTHVTPAAVQCPASVPVRATMIQVGVQLPTRVSSNRKQTPAPLSSRDCNHATSDSTQHIPVHAQCQLLTLELWSDELRLSTTHVVIPPQQQTCSLWDNSSTRCMRLAMTELSAVEQQLWRLGAAIRQEEVRSWHEFQHDLCLWLQAVRMAAETGRCYPGFCRTARVVSSNIKAPGPCYELGTRAGSHSEPALQPQVVVQLGTDLIGYMSDQVSLRCLKQMVTDQVKHVVRPWAEKQSNYQPTLNHLYAVWESVCTACFGYPCPTCEAAYKAQLSRMLAGYQAVAASFLLLIAALALASAVLRYAVMPVHVLFLLWALSCVLTIAHHMIPQHRQHPSCSMYGLWSWVSRMAVNLCLGLHWGTPYHKVVKSLSMYLLTHFLIAIGEQLPSESLVPTWVTCVLVLLDLPGVYLSAFLCQVDGWNWFGAVAALLLAVVVGPRILSMQLRSMLAAK